jgi:hypothetical protein
MSLPQDILSTALVGTERQPVALPSGRDALGKLLSQHDPNQREASLLGAAGVISIYARVGRLPAQTGTVPPVASAAEESPHCSALAGDHLKMMLGGQNAEVLHEWLGAAARAGKITWPELLPSLLELGRSKPEFREAILPLLGKRGRWLATQNPVWGYVAGDGEDDSIWQTGNRAARVLLLQRVRAQNPEHARELLVATWAQEPAEERSAFIPLLRFGLSSADEPFLESALDDWRKEVREQAARLLARLPESRLNQRMMERAKALLKFTPTEAGSVLKLKGKRKPRLEITLPAACDTAMKRDGIESSARPGKGEKGWWLTQIVSSVRPVFWCETWAKTPLEVLLAADGTEWKKELLEGWTQAAVHHGDAVWAESLLDVWEDGQNAQALEGLMGVLPPEKRETFIVKMIAESKKPVFSNMLLLTLLRGCSHTWSRNFTKAILNELRRACASGKESFDWQVRASLKEFACFMDPMLAKEAETGWPTDSKTWESSAETINQMLGLLQFRHGMLEELKK